MAVPTEEQKKRFGKFKSWLTYAQEAKRPLEAEWALNLSFYLGDQWTRYNTNKKEIYRTKIKNVKQYVHNVIYPAVQVITAKVTAPNPVIKTAPKTGSSEDINAARISTLVAQSELWEAINMPLQLQRIVPILATMGSIHYFPYFNPDAGKIIGQDESGKDIREGRMEADFLTGYEFTPDPEAVDDKNTLERFAISKYRSRTWVWENFGEVVEPGKDNTLSAYKQFQHHISGTSPYNDKESVLVHTFFEKRTREYPRGRYYVVTDCGKELDYIEELPWGLAESNILPVVKIDYESVAGAYWGKAPISACRQQQRIINKVVSMYLAHIGLFSFPPILNPIGNGIKKNTVDFTSPGNWVDYLPGMDNSGVPQFMQTPQFSPQIINMMQMMKGSIDDIFGVHDISRATAPSGVKTGRALSILDAADDTKLHPLVVNLENGVSRGFQIGLLIVNNTYETPRLIKMVGGQNGDMITDFVGADLDGNTDVKIKMRSALPMNKMAAIDTVVTFMREGLIPKNPDGIKAAQTMIDMDEITGLLESSLDEEQARYENSILDTGAKGKEVDKPIVNPDTGEPAIDANGQPMTERVFAGMPINDWDHHEIHIAVIERRQKSIGYYKLIEKEPDVHEAYTLHKERHREAMMAHGQRQMQMQKQQQAEQTEMQLQIKEAITRIETEAKKSLEDAKAQFEEEKEIAVAYAKAEIEESMGRANQNTDGKRGERKGQ